MKNFKAYRWAAVLLLLSAVLLQAALPVCAKTAKKTANTAAKTAAKTEARASSDPVWDIILFWGQSRRASMSTIFSPIPWRSFAQAT